MASKKRALADRNAQLIRVLAIIRDLDRLGGVDVYELAERHGVSVRTLWRDLEAIQSAGLPLVEETAGKRKRWRVAFRDHLAKLSTLLDASHYLALRVAMGQGGSVRSATGLFAALEDLSDKIEDVLGPRERELLRAVDRCFFAYEKFAYRHAPAEVFWPLVRAIAERRLCVVSYRAPRVDPYDAVFRILPLRLFSHDGAIYFHAHVIKHDDIVALNLHRLRYLELLDKKGTPPKDYSPEKWESAAFRIFAGGKPVQYRLRFDAEAAPYILERVWHPTQKVKKLRGKGVELTFTCGESYEVAGWVASWREHVEVIAPESLRDEMGRYAGWLAGRYSASSAPA